MYENKSKTGCKEGKTIFGVKYENEKNITEKPKHINNMKKELPGV